MSLVNLLTPRKILPIAGLGIIGLLSSCADLAVIEQKTVKSINRMAGVESAQDPENSPDYVPDLKVALPAKEKHGPGYFQLIDAKGIIFVTLAVLDDVPNELGKYTPRGAFAAGTPFNFMYDSYNFRGNAPDVVSVYDSNGKTISQFTDDNSSKKRFIARRFDEGLPAGQYSLHLLKNGKFERRVPFSVTNSP